VKPSRLILKERDNKPGKVFLGVAHRLDRASERRRLFAKNIKKRWPYNNTFSAQTPLRKNMWHW